MQHVTEQDLQSDDIRKQFEQLDSSLNECLSDHNLQLKVEWVDGTASWLPLSEAKNASPIERAEYAVASQIDHEPAFKWCVPGTLKKRKQIVAKVKSRYWCTTHKFGVKLPHSIEEAYKFDAENGNGLCRHAIEQEMSHVHITFDNWLGGSTRVGAKKKLVGYQEIRWHMIFDIKMAGLACKAQVAAIPLILQVLSPIPVLFPVTAYGLQSSLLL